MFSNATLQRFVDDHSTRKKYSLIHLNDEHGEQFVETNREALIKYIGGASPSRSKISFTTQCNGQSSDETKAIASGGHL